MKKLLLLTTALAFISLPAWSQTIGDTDTPNTSETADTGVENTGPTADTGEPNTSETADTGVKNEGPSADTETPSASPDTETPSENPDAGAGEPEAAPVEQSAQPSTPAPSGYVHTPTRVEQLQAKLAYQLEEIEEGNTQYYGKASKQTAINLAKALAAAANGTPLSPMLTEKGAIVPLSKWDDDYSDPHTIY